MSDCPSFNPLTGRIALVTGAIGGIGSAVVHSLAHHGALVVGADILPDEAGAAWAAGFGDAAGKVYYHQLDVTDEGGWDKLIAAIMDEHVDLDILVHNAGIISVSSLAQTSFERHRQIMAVNSDGSFLGTKAALPLMAATGKKRPFGTSMIFMSSVGGLVGHPSMTSYCMSKGAVRLFSKACAIEFSALGHKIRVNSVHPGGVLTPMNTHIMSRLVESGVAPDVDSVMVASHALHPIGRMAEPEDIAKMVLFLASDESGYVHGAEMVIDGGYTSQ